MKITIVLDIEGTDPIMEDPHDIVHELLAVDFLPQGDAEVPR